MYQDKIEQSILERYKVLKKIGNGAYGHVWKVKCKQTGETKALKKVFDAYQHATDAQRTYREIGFLKQLSHPNIIKLEEVIQGDNHRDVYLIFEHMPTDLHKAIAQKVLESQHKKYVLYELLLVAAHLHSARLIHRDLKPSNVLLNGDCEVKLCDFGLARLESSPTQEQVMTEGVATRWYRAPEVLLGSKSYDQKADIWSIGCIAAEIFLGTPLFQGSSTIQQLEKILQYTGKPTKEDLKSLDSETGCIALQQFGNIHQKSNKELFNHTMDTTLLNLLSKLLQFNSHQRLSAEQALKHPYFSELYKAGDIKEFKGDLTLEVNDNIKLRAVDYYALITNLQNPFLKVSHPSSPKSKSKASYSQKAVKTPQRFSDLKKTKDPRFGSLLKNRQESTQKSQTEKKQDKGLHLFEQIIKRNGDSSVNHSRLVSNSKQKGKENLHANNAPNLQRFETKNQMSFNALKKTAPKFKK